MVPASAKKFMCQMKMRVEKEFKAIARHVDSGKG